jgi:TP901 family phage tail tape measure protein
MADYNLGTARGKAEIDTSDVASASKELKNADLVLRGTGQSLINFGQQALQAFGYVVGVGAKFEKEMDFIQAVTNGSAEEMEALRQKAIELGKSGPFGPIALSQAFVELAKAGVSAQDIVDGVGQSVVNLAGAADITATQAGEIIVQTMAIFGLAAEEVPRATDLIAGAANASMIDVQDFATTLKYAGPVAAALGIDLEDLATTISLLGQSGIKGSTAGTSLRQTLLNLSGATPKARDRMRELGLITSDGSNAFYDAAGNVKDLASVFDILGKSMANLNEKQKQEALRDIFGVRQLPTVLFLLEQGRDKFDEFNAAINETTAGDVAAKRLDNLDGAVKRFKATLESVLLGPSGPFQNMLKNFVNGARQLLLWFDALPGPVKTFLLGAVGVIGVLSLLSGVFLLTVGNIVRAVRVFSELATLASRLPALLSSVATAARAVSAAFLANPIVLIIAAIIALAVAFYFLYTRVEGFRKFIDSTWQTIQKVWDAILGFVKRIPEEVGKAWDWLASHTTKIWDSVYAKVSGVIEAIINFFSDLPGKVGGFLSSLASTIGNFFAGVGGSIGRFFTGLPGQIASALGTAASAIAGFLAELPKRVGYIIGFVIGRFIRLHIELAKLIFNIGKTVVTTFIKVITRLPGLIFNILKTVLSTMATWGTQAVSKAIEIGAKILNGIIDFVVQLPGRLFNLLTQALQFLIDKIPEFTAGSIQLGGAILDSIVSFILQIPGKVWQFLTEALSTLVGLVSSFFSAAYNIGKAIVDGILGVITGLPGLVWDILQNVIGAFTDLIKSAFNAAKNFAKGLWEGFKDGLGINSPSFIEEAMFDIQDEAALTRKLLDQQIRKMGLAGNKFVSSINSGSLGLPTPAAVAAQGQGGTTFNAPLVGQATIRDDRDIVTLARELENERRRQERARGRTLVSTGGG